MSSDHFTPVGCLDIGDETLPKLYYGDYKGFVSTASDVQGTNCIFYFKDHPRT